MLTIKTRHSLNEAAILISLVYSLLPMYLFIQNLLFSGARFTRHLKPKIFVCSIQWAWNLRRWSVGYKFYFLFAGIFYLIKQCFYLI